MFELDSYYLRLCGAHDEQNKYEYYRYKNKETFSIH